MGKHILHWIEFLLLYAGTQQCAQKYRQRYEYEGHVFSLHFSSHAPALVTGNKIKAGAKFCPDGTGCSGLGGVRIPWGEEEILLCVFEE